MFNLTSRSRKICASLALCSLAFCAFPSGDVSAHGDLWKLIHRGIMQDKSTEKATQEWYGSLAEQRMQKAYQITLFAKNLMNFIGIGDSGFAKTVANFSKDVFYGYEGKTTVDQKHEIPSYSTENTYMGMFNMSNPHDANNFSYSQAEHLKNAAMDMLNIYSRSSAVSKDLLHTGDRIEKMSTGVSVSGFDDGQLGSTVANMQKQSMLDSITLDLNANRALTKGSSALLEIENIRNRLAEDEAFRVSGAGWKDYHPEEKVTPYYGEDLKYVNAKQELVTILQPRKKSKSRHQKLRLSDQQKC